MFPVILGNSPPAVKKHQRPATSCSVLAGDGGIVGNIVIEAKDAEAAKHKLRERYPDCEMLECVFYASGYDGPMNNPA
jgi:hypothetical protein